MAGCSESAHGRVCTNNSQARCARGGGGQLFAAALFVLLRVREAGTAGTVARLPARQDCSAGAPGVLLLCMSNVRAVKCACGVCVCVCTRVGAREFALAASNAPPTLHGRGSAATGGRAGVVHGQRAGAAEARARAVKPGRGQKYSESPFHSGFI